MAFLWQFVVIVTHAEIDPTPVLKFSPKIENKAHVIEVLNEGWGSANSCQIKVDEPRVLAIWDIRVRRFGAREIALEGQKVESNIAF